MTAVGRSNVGAAIVAGIVLAGWIVTVIVRNWRGIPVEVAAEGTAMILAAGGLYAKMAGRNGSGPDDGAAS